LPFLYLILAASLGFATEEIIAATTNKTSTHVSQSAEKKPVQVFTTTQYMEGATEANLDQTTLKEIETWLVETWIEKIKNSMTEKGMNPKDIEINVSSSSVYFIVEGKKLAIVKAKEAITGFRSVVIMGIKENEFIRVSCFRPSDHDIPIWRGKCGDEVQKVFGVSMQL